MKENNVCYENKYDLPEMCFTVHTETGALICIRFGIDGFFKSKLNTRSKEKNEELAKQMNSHLGITQAQKSAMIHGSMFGWDTPGTNPKNYKNIKGEEVWHEKVYKTAKEAGLEVKLDGDKFVISAIADMNTKHSITVHAYPPKGYDFFLIDLCKAIRNFNIPKEVYPLLSEDGYYHTKHIFRYDMKFLYKALEKVKTQFQMFCVLLGGSYSGFTYPWHTETWDDSDIIACIERLNKEEVTNLPRSEYGKAVIDIRLLLNKTFDESASDRSEMLQNVIEGYFKNRNK